MTIHRRCLFCLVENNGARICFDGRSQTIQPSVRNQKKASIQEKRDIHSIIECKEFTYGIRIGGVKMMSNRCPSKKSELHSDISTTLTMNSLAGWDMAELPSPRPYHLPVHQARLVSSCLNSRVRKTPIRIF